MKREYDFITSNGLLTGIKITMTEQEFVRRDSLNDSWLETIYMELLLNIDEVWRTTRQLMKFSNLNKTSSNLKVKSVLDMLIERGLVEKKRVGNRHTEYRRVMKYPQNYGGGEE